MRRPPLDLSLKLPPRPDDDAVREYYERQLAEGGDDGYESTGYATSGVGESSRRAPPPDPFRHDPALASPPRRRRELPRDDVDAPPSPVDRRAPRSRATAPSPVANGGQNFTGDLDRYGDGTSRGAASWRSFGSSADAPSGSGRDPGRRPSPAPGTSASTEHAPSEPPSSYPPPCRPSATWRKSATPPRAPRAPPTRAAAPDPRPAFTVADRDEDYATPRLDDDGDGTGDDALGVASKTRDQLPTPLRDPNRREGDQNRRGPRRRSRAPARRRRVRRRRRPADRERERRAPTQTRTHEEAMIPRGTREASLRTREEASPRRTRRFLPRRGRARLPLRLARRRFPGGRSRFVSPSLALGVRRGGARDRGGASGKPQIARSYDGVGGDGALPPRARSRCPRAARAAPVASGTRNPCGTAIDRVCVV